MRNGTASSISLFLYHNRGSPPLNQISVSAAISYFRMTRVLPDNCRHVMKDHAANAYNKLAYLHNSTNHIRGQDVCFNVQQILLQ